MRATERETGYLCTYSSPAGSGSNWVRAWSAQQARELLRMQLRDAGIDNDVAVHVVEPARHAASPPKHRSSR